MTLTTEEVGDVPDVAAAALDEILTSQACGTFASLSASETDFVQAGCDWRPDEPTQAFVKAHGPAPFVLEYREGRQLFQATGRVTLEQVRQALLSYLGGTSQWRNRFSWTVIREFER